MIYNQAYQINYRNVWSTLCFQKINLCILLTEYVRRLCVDNRARV